MKDEILQYIKSKDAQKLLGISLPTLRKYVREGKIREVKLSRSKILYCEEDVYGLIGYRTKKESLKKNVIYARVSTQSQKNQLQSQTDRLHEWCIKNGIDISITYEDIKSGMSFDRKNFNQLILEIVRNNIALIIIENKDRLCRFGFELLETFCKCFGTRIIVVNDSYLSKTAEQEMTEDLISIVHHFSMKLYSKRRKINKIKKLLNQIKLKDNEDD